jgi:serine/threonine-protein kinase
MGEVRRAHDRRLDRDVAVKLLDSPARQVPEALARFEYEARAAAALTHPNVVRVYDYGDDGDCVYLVMEALSGRTLGDEIARGPVAPDRLVEVACDVLAGLAAAHARGIVHRDIKPGNVLFDDSDRAKLGDFGVATSGTLDLTQTGLVLGTPAYVAPERLAGEPATPRSDIFAVGVVCYEALAGVKPFTGDAPLAIARAIDRGQPLHLRERRSGIDPALAAVVMRAMQREPAHRYESAEELASALRATDPSVSGADEPATEAIPRIEARTRAMPVAEAASAPTAAAPPSAPPGTRPGRRRRGRTRALLVLLVVVLVGAGGTALALRDHNSSSSRNDAPLPAGPVRDGFDHLEELLQR